MLGAREIVPGYYELRLRASPPPRGWRAGHEIQLRTEAGPARHYTVWRAEPDEITVLADTAGGGPGASLVRSLAAGAEVPVSAGPYTSLRQNGSRRLYAGDLSALGTIDAYVRGSADHSVVIEAPFAVAGALAECWPGYRFLPTGGDLLSFVESLSAADGLDGAVLLGSAQSIQAWRAALVGRKVVARRAITTKPYWAAGRSGL